MPSKRFTSLTTSLKEWWVRVPQGWWGVIGIILTFIPLASGVIAFSVWTRRVKPPLPWWDIGLVAAGALLFFVFSFLAFHRVRVERDEAREEKEKQLESIRKANPSIEVRPLKVTGLDHCLEVKNIGVAGEFSAQIELIESHSLGGTTNDYPYVGFWELANSGRARIQCNQTDRLKIVAFDIDNKERRRRLRFYYTDSKTGGLNSYDSKWVKKGTISKCKIRVTISSVPDLLGQSYILEKELDTWGLKWPEQWVKVKSQ